MVRIGCLFQRNGSYSVFICLLSLSCHDKFDRVDRRITFKYNFRSGLSKFRELSRTMQINLFAGKGKHAYIIPVYSTISLKPGYIIPWIHNSGFWYNIHNLGFWYNIHSPGFWYNIHSPDVWCTISPYYRCIISFLHIMTVLYHWVWLKSIMATHHDTIPIHFIESTMFYS